MDDGDYDEFGNYIGPELDGENSDSGGEGLDANGDALGGGSHGGGSDPDEERQEPGHDFADGNNNDDGTAMAADSGRQVALLPEDKQYYESAQQLFGAGVDVQVQEEDTQPLDMPIIAPVKEQKLLLKEKTLDTVYDKEYLLALTNSTERIRQISVVGALHHGKTAFVDMLVAQTHENLVPTQRKFDRASLRYTDIHEIEVQRGLSVKATPLSLLLPDSRGRSHVVHLMDTPGHVDFFDEVCASVRISDGAVLLVDAVEGAMLNMDRVIRLLVQAGTPLVLVINKIDRLILELKLTPKDAYFKLRHTIEEINSMIKAHDVNGRYKRLTPECGNVCFASSEHKYVFTLESFARMQHEQQHGGFDPKELARRLWGDLYYGSETRRFYKSNAGDGGMERSFIHFVLNPLYKVYAHIVGEERPQLAALVRRLGLAVKPAAFSLDVAALLPIVLSAWFRDAAPFVDAVAAHVGDPAESHVRKLGAEYSAGAFDFVRPEAAAPLRVHVTKLYPNQDGATFDALGRIYSGAVREGQRVKVLGDHYTADDEEDSVVTTVRSVALPVGRYRIRTPRLGAGNWVLLGGVDSSIVKTATIVSADDNEDDDEEEAAIFKPNRAPDAVMKVAIEPIIPTELPKMLDGLRKINKTFPGAVTRVEESGEHVVFGAGEMYLDCIMHDLRRQYAEIEIKISDPITRFSETIVEISALKCTAEAPNKKSRLTMIAEPLDKGLAEDIEGGRVPSLADRKGTAKFFGERYKWDILAARNLWAFGPADDGPNALINDTLPAEVDTKLLFSIRESVKQGFQWGAREGPLCDEPMRNCKFKILGAQIASEPILRGSGQIIPTARRACYSAFLTASPRLMEPIYQVEVIAPADCVSAVYTVLARRRGHVTLDLPKAGTPLYIVKAMIPVIDSCGFETDLRTHTQGQAFCQQVFDSWQIVPGDPLDKNIPVRPLEPAAGPTLARDFMVKTRRRKGLSQEVSIIKYFDTSAIDDETLALLAQSVSF